MKFVYTRPVGHRDGEGVSIVVPAPKESLEKLFGPMTDDAYRAHVIERSIPKGVDFREITDDDLPSTREFRNAWCDVTPESRIDIDLSKAKNIQLDRLRLARNEALKESDILMTRVLEDSDSQAINALKTKRQALRDATEPLKALDAEGKFNDEEILQSIRELGSLK